MLSILIPVYNYDINQLIEVLEIQARCISLNYEIIVGDDCSTDNNMVKTQELITSYSNYSYFRNAKNIGRISTRLELARRAKYDWLLFLDADVLPDSEDFLNQVISNCDTEFDLIFGGIKYPERPQRSLYKLHWLYGKQREERNLTFRKANSYQSIVSGCLLIKKNKGIYILSEINEKRYGTDILLSYIIKRENMKVKHIVNPVIHLGLENNSVFLQKSIESINTTLHLEKMDKIPVDYRPIQKYYHFLRKTKSTKVFIKIFSIVEPLILRNLNSNYPCLTLFDVYRLLHYSKNK